MIARRRPMRGVGDSGGQSLVTASGGSGANYNDVGQYIGGTPLMDFWCNSVFGSWMDSCKVSTPAQIKARQDAELATTSAPPDVQLQAISAADQAVIDDASTHPIDYQNQIAASDHPTLSAIFGTGVVSQLFPQDVSDPFNPKATFPWLSAALLVGGVVVLIDLLGGKR